MTNICFIGYPNCSTCKKAYKALNEMGLEVEYRDISKDNPTKEEIQSWIAQGIPLKDLFNTSGKLYRELNMKEKRKTASDEELIDLLSTNGMLVKRPVVIGNHTILVGNKISEYEKLKD